MLQNQVPANLKAKLNVGTYKQTRYALIKSRNTAKEESDTDHQSVKHVAVRFRMLRPSLRRTFQRIFCVKRSAAVAKLEQPNRQPSAHVMPMSLRVA